MVFAFVITLIAVVINSGDVSREEEEWNRNSKRILEDRAQTRAEEVLGNSNE